MNYKLDEDTKKIIGNKLRELRRQRKLNQREVAFEINMSREHYSHIENGTRGISQDMMFVLMNFYKEDANTILCLKRAK